MKQMSQEPQQGLWAYFEGKYYGLKFNDLNRNVDHVTWFLDIGLPDYGPGFDRVLRGRMLWDWHFNFYVLTFYGTRSLPNTTYDWVTKFFEVEGHKVVERPAASRWG